MEDNANAGTLSSLGVDIRSVASVERDVVAAAEASAVLAEDKEFHERDAAIAADIEQLRAELSRKRDPPLTAAGQRLMRRRIAQALQRRESFRQAHQARKSLAGNISSAACPKPGAQSIPSADDHARDDAVQRLPNETQRDFDIRTGKITPFQSDDAFKVEPQRRRTLRSYLARGTPETIQPSYRKRFLPSDSDFDREYEQNDDNDLLSLTEDGVAKTAPEQQAPDDEEVVLNGGLAVPANLYDRLFDFQKTGLQWLWELHNQGCGGILADEMGLGKTIQVVAFLASLHHSGKLSGATLVVAPATVLKQWSREFTEWYPPFYVRILHHAATTMEGAGKKRRVASSSSDSSARTVRDVARSKAPAVLITSYEQVRKHHELLWDAFEYVILDEGHKIRNPDAEITIICKQFNTPHRILLTGTPLQNNLRELWSLFDFVHPGRLGTLVVFDAQFNAPISLGGYASASKSQVHTAYRCAVTLRDLVSPYLLRRQKRDVSISLPDKHEHVLFCKLTPEQREAYKHFLQSRTIRLVLSGRLNLLYAITVLRKICNHVDIATCSAHWDGPRFCSASIRAEEVRNAPCIPGEVTDVIDTSSPDFGGWQRSGKMKVLDTVLSSWREEGCRALIFSQTKVMLDILATFAEDRGYTYSRMDGQTPIASRMQIIDEYNEDESIFLFLLTSRVGGLGVNLTGADRVLLYDPDWNPSTDLQARERAWRIGQRKSVTVYRFVTSGTIEEKIYHRQIYKQFLSNKVLNDPRQRRFFKRKDMKDLFSLGEESDKGTETADLFAGAATEVTRKADSQTDADNAENANDTTPDSGTRLLKSLFDSDDSNSELHSVMNHDDIIGAGETQMDTELVKYEADRVVSKALAEVRRSGHERSRNGVNVPTWTGRSGLAGIPRLSVSTLNGMPSPGLELLRKIKEREEGVIPEMKSAVRSHNSSSENAIENVTREVIEFLKSKGGSASSDEVVSRFDDRVGNGQVGNGKVSLIVFKSVLKAVAVLHKNREQARMPQWVLKKEYAEANTDVLQM